MDEESLDYIGEGQDLLIDKSPFNNTFCQRTGITGLICRQYNDCPNGPRIRLEIVPGIGVSESHRQLFITYISS
jgi:hypothetical protein